MIPEGSNDIQAVQDIVARRFPIYETRVTAQGAVQFMIRPDPATMEAKFEDLRIELVPKNFIPFLTQEGGEHAILVQRRAQQRFVTWRVNLILLALTIATTLWAGAVNWAGYDGLDGLPAGAWAMGGLTFTLPLLLILGIHEMGHFLMARRYKVRASLPFFLPAPFTFLGTFGAMISMRDPMPSRKALIDIGAAGPILGLITAIPVTILGLVLMSVDPRPSPVNSGGLLTIQLPLLYLALSYFVPIPTDAILHPTAFAGWVGLFVTALNLLPAGQLDGGHVARAVFGDKTKYLSYGAIALMLGLGLFARYEGWLIIAVFILLLGARHPPPLNDLTRLDVKRYGLASGAALVLVLSFVAIPVAVIQPRVNVQFEDAGAPNVAVTELNATVTNGTVSTFTFVVRNSEPGNVETNVSLALDRDGMPNVRLNVSFVAIQAANRTISFSENSTWFTLNSTESASVTLSFNATDYELPPGDVWPLKVTASARLEGTQLRVDRNFLINLRVA